MKQSHTVTYTVEIHDEGADGFWAEVEELPGCFASGRDMNELNEALAEAIGLYLSTPNMRAEVRLSDGPVTSERVDHVEQRFLVST